MANRIAKNRKSPANEEQLIARYLELNPKAKMADGLDVARLLQLQAIMQQANKHDKNVDLLLALKPLLKEENQVKIDRVIKIFKLFAIYPALKESGLLGGDLFGLL